jgi:uncharacterized protein
LKTPGVAQVLAALLSFAAPLAQAQTPDAGLMGEIAKIRAIDNHCHSDPAYPERGADWKPENPLGTSRYPDVVPLRHDNPDWLRAWGALYGYGHSDMAPAQLRTLLGEKRKLLRERGDAWPAEVLDKSGIDIALVNTTALGAGQAPPRFRWVPYGDSFLWPFSGDKTRVRFNGPGGSIAELMKAVNVVAVPATLAEYEAKVIAAVLAKWKGEGAVAVKFMTAYARAIDFNPVATDIAAPLYIKGVSGALGAVENKILEDYLFTAVAARAGTHGLVVHVHTGNGDGPFFNNANANPIRLENVLVSRELRKTNFVLVHGGWPLWEVAQAMTDKPNTYVDFSAQTFYLSTPALARVLRGWLEWQPEKVLFGTDAYSDVDSALSDYEEKQWLGADKARRALAIALTGMMQDELITRARALQIARLVLRENARKLYGL